MLDRTRAREEWLHRHSPLYRILKKIGGTLPKTAPSQGTIQPESLDDAISRVREEQEYWRRRGY